jgi:trk system potassium uptake protein TrkH
MFARPRVIIRRAIGSQPVTSEELLELLTPIPIYLFLQFTLSMALAIVGNYSFIDSLFEITSALSCVGLSVGIISPDADPFIKIIIIIAMYLGRLEFLQLMLIIGYISSEKVRRALK